MSDNPSNPSDWKERFANPSRYYAIGEDYVEQAFLAAREVLDEHPEWDVKLTTTTITLTTRTRHGQFTIW